MSDFSKGPGWWQASDGKWYPPEAASPEPGTPPSYIVEPGNHPNREGPWRKFRSWPKAVQAVCWALAAVLVVGVIAGITGNNKNSSKVSSSPPTTVVSTTRTPTTTVAPTTVAPTTVAPTTAAPTTAASTTAAPTTAAPTTVATNTSSLTPSQQNAIQSAQQYLDMGEGFSRAGLIEQLSSQAGEGYPLADATFAVDYLHVDWNAQAALSAKNYLKMESFSCNGLIEQLSSSAGEQFTLSQAQYGAKAAGIC